MRDKEGTQSPVRGHLQSPSKSPLRGAATVHSVSIVVVPLHNGSGSKSAGKLKSATFVLNE